MRLRVMSGIKKFLSVDINIATTCVAYKPVNSCVKAGLCYIPVASFWKIGPVFLHVASCMIQVINWDHEHNMTTTTIKTEIA